jgi:PAS domain-containing protein
MSPSPAARAPLRCRPACWLGLLVGVLVLAPADGLAATLPRHPLELRALVEPDAVRALLPALQRDAEAAGDRHALALLKLAEANACRVLSAWNCQRSAAEAARTLAQALDDPALEVRAILLLSSALVALYDYPQVETLLGEAELLLQRAPQPTLAGDVMLAYSSLSYPLGRIEDSLKYAERGLDLLAALPPGPIHARLLRNQARALGDLGRLDAARSALDRGRAAAEAVDDPKLVAELLLESASLALRMGDLAAHARHVDAVDALARRLNNRQLSALGAEARALGRLRAGDAEGGRVLLERARADFAFLDQQRDELRVSLRLLEMRLETDWQRADLEPLLRRFLDLDRQIGQLDREQLASDFEARLQLARQRLELARLEGEARLAEARATALQLRENLALAIGASALLLAAALLALFLHQQRARRRLQQAMEALKQSEARATDLLRLNPGPVFLHDDEGRLLLINPAAAEALGARAIELEGQPLARFLDETSQPLLQDYLRALRHRGEAEALVTLPERGAGAATGASAAGYPRPNATAPTWSPTPATSPRRPRPPRRCASRRCATSSPAASTAATSSASRKPAANAPTGRRSTSTSTASSRSTTPTATTAATRCCARWRRSSAPACATTTPSCASAATSSWCCSNMPMPRTASS